ncbi:LPS O-antigen length regulator [Legionella nautarum]|uniref:LPS O-antigen length regulator n=1 Tax=Legionella nautarum TaxID=45070 RepID=A0A0W0WUB6_9GAMM|nr:Wzz/FepE/Etk N-terminal domain-containing protein [Legionella nautarum]KTD35893.1 LPS O-antigen length regulator [Legionella nautarum]
MEGQQLKEARINNEMTLIDFLQAIWKQKLLITLSTTLGLFLGFACILLASPVYEAVSFISPPSQGDIAALNQGRLRSKKSLLNPYEVKEVYDIFTKELQAESTKRLFFNRVFLPSMKNKTALSQAKLYANFSKSLKIKEIKSLPNSFTTPPSNYIVAIQGRSPEQDAEWVTKYIALAKQKALEGILTDIDHQHKNVMRELGKQIDSIREVANSQRLDRVQQLKEAIKVAQAVGVKGNSISRIITDASAANDPSLMYLRGSVALQAELTNIENRVSSDAFAPSGLKLRETQAMLELYKKITINPAKVMLFKQDGEVIIPDLPIAPHKKLVLILALFAGFFTGVIWVLTRRSLTLIFK